MAYFESAYYTTYFDVDVAAAAATAFYGGHFGDPGKPFHYIKRFPAYDRIGLRKELQALLYPEIKPLEVPGRVAVREPEQPTTPVIDTIRRVSPRYAYPIRIPDADVALRRLFRDSVRVVIKKRKKRRRDEEAIMVLLH